MRGNSSFLCFELRGLNRLLSQHTTHVNRLAGVQPSDFTTQWGYYPRGYVRPVTVVYFQSMRPSRTNSDSLPEIGNLSVLYCLFLMMSTSNGLINELELIPGGYIVIRYIYTHKAILYFLAFYIVFFPLGQCNKRLLRGI